MQILMYLQSECWIFLQFVPSTAEELRSDISENKLREKTVYVSERNSK
jgi:hypothetical protein